MKAGKALLSLLLTLSLLLMSFGGGAVFALEEGGPTIEVSIADHEEILPKETVVVSANENGAAVHSLSVTLEGKTVPNEKDAFVCRFSPEALSLSPERVYTAVATASDTDGRETVRIIPFKVTQHPSRKEVTVANGTVQGSGNITAYAADVLEVTAKYGSTQNGAVSLEDGNALDPLSTYQLQYTEDAVVTSSATGIPYQRFDISLGGRTEGLVTVTYEGETLSGERVALKVYRPQTGTWDTVGTFTESGMISAQVDIARYSEKDTIHMLAMPDYVTNGSDALIWITDPQHYTKFDDLNAYYAQMYQYAADQYTAGNIGYVMNTGDLVDDRPSSPLAAKQWAIADAAMKKAEEAGLPNGLVAGNHDVGDFKKENYEEEDNTSSDYSKFCETFGAERYNDKPWYGGSLNNNISHYDLITVGNVDLVVLFLGYGLEATDETIAWANGVLQTYRHRTAIVATHQYLLNATADRAEGSRAQLIYDAIVEPNPNVKLVLCGHDDGSQVVQRTAKDGRTVYEILSDYQFVQAEDPEFYHGEEHAIGSVTGCCGDGYLRTMTISGNTLSSVTYSPVTGRYAPYGDRETFTLDVDFGIARREMATIRFGAAVAGEEIASGTDSVTVPGGRDWFASVTGDGYTAYTAPVFAEIPDAPAAEPMLPNDRAGLAALIEKARNTSGEGCTGESFQELQAAVASAETALASADNGEIARAALALATALGKLTPKKEILDAAALENLYTYDMALARWTDTNANLPLGSQGCYIDAAQTEDGGLQMRRSPVCIEKGNGWPSARYRADGPITLHPNGKIYLNLDVQAWCSWSMHFTVRQGNRTVTLLPHYAIEHFFYNPAADGFAGDYRGVYDITQAFIDAGLNPAATMTVEESTLWIVPGSGNTRPGNVVYTRLEWMTDPSSGAVDRSQLENLIHRAEQFDLSEYTVSSAQRLAGALDDARRALADTASVQSDINLAEDQLQDAIDRLKKPEDLIPEPENSLIPADEGLWIPRAGDEGHLDIYRDEENHTVLQNTDNNWPTAEYTLPTPYRTPVAGKALAMDITVGHHLMMKITVDGKVIDMPVYISPANVEAGSGDLLSGTYQVSIPLSNLPGLAGKESVSIEKIAITPSGPAASSAIVIRKLAVEEYTAPPQAETEPTSMLPASDDQVTKEFGEGSWERKSDGTIVMHTVESEKGDRIYFSPSPVYDMTVLNGLHLTLSSTVPFKFAIKLVGANDQTVAWPSGTAQGMEKIFPINTETDRIEPGEYDVSFDIADLSPGVKDKTAVYFEQFILLTSGTGTLTLSACDAVEVDNFTWDDSLTYGEPATPDHPYFAHAAKEGPAVEKKVDVLRHVGLTKHPTISQWTPDLGKGKPLTVNLEETPYLYISVAQADTSSFSFSFFNDMSKGAPFLLFRDQTQTENGKLMNTGSGNWDGYQNHEQYVRGSETLCIDMRDWLTDPNAVTWTVNSVNFYNHLKQPAVVAYMYFGSEPLPDDTPIPEPDLGDVDASGIVDIDDAEALYLVVSGKKPVDSIHAEAADLNADGKVDMKDAYLLYHLVSGRKDDLPT